ncbi:MAG: hypothetical protein ABR525_07910 [Candidatus Limnocylindria bacterium]
MLRRFVLAAALALTAALLVPGQAANAGGWAVTTFDDLPGQFVAGQSYTLGYTIRQHGVTPIKADSTGIYLQTSSGGIAASFPGSADGALGHYVATVRFPSAGAFRWFVTQAPFGDQQLGPITIVPAAGQAQPGQPAAPAPVEPAVAAPRGSNELGIRVGLATASLAASLLFVWLLTRYRRRATLRVA